MSCNKCKKEIDYLKTHVVLVVSKEHHCNDGEIEVEQAYDICEYHEDCSPFK